MRFLVSSTVLLKHLQVVGSVVNSNNTLPILDNFLFELKENQLTVTATDLETTISMKLEVESDSAFNVAIPAKMLLDTLKTFPEQPLKFSIITEKNTVEISSDQGKYELAYQNADEYPKAPEIESANMIQIEGDTLARAFNKTVFAAGNDELRPVMSGVFCEFNSEGVTFVATDAHKLVRFKQANLKSDINSSFILPKKPINLLRTIVSGLDDVITLEYNETNAKFKSENLSLSCRMIDGKYPNYSAVIPQDNPNKLLIDRQSFLNSVKRVSIFSNKTTHQIRLKLSRNHVQVSAEDLDFSNKAVEKLNCQYEGEEMEIGFNSKFLTEMLSHLETEEINLEMSMPNRAGILLPHHEEENEEDILMLVMPVMLNH